MTAQLVSVRLTRACRCCAGTRPRIYSHKGSIVGSQTVSWPLANLCGRTRSVTLGRQCVTPTHTLTDGPGMTLRAVIIQHLTESVVLSWRLHSWAHKGTLAMWYKWLAYFSLVWGRMLEKSYSRVRYSQWARPHYIIMRQAQYYVECIVLCAGPLWQKTVDSAHTVHETLRGCPCAHLLMQSIIHSLTRKCHSSGDFHYFYYYFQCCFEGYCKESSVFTLNNCVI